MLHRLRNTRSWLSLALVTTVVIPAISSVTPHSALAVSPPENPAFTVDLGSLPSRFQLRFTPVSGIARYVVRMYVKSDNYDSVAWSSNNYVSGNDIGSANALNSCGFDTPCIELNTSRPVKFTIQGYDSSNNAVTNESSKSIPYIPTTDRNPVFSSPVNIAESVIRVPFNPNPGQTSMSVRLYRSDDNYTQIFREVSDISAPGKDISVPGGFSYSVKFRIIGSTENNVGYLSTPWKSDGNTINVSVRPNAPANVQLTGGNGTITATWTEPVAVPGAAISSYLMSFSSDKITWVNYSATSSDRSIEAVSLTNGQQYWVRMRSRTLSGLFGEWVAPTPVIPSWVPNPPSLSLLGGDERIDATWLAPSLDGGAPITNYVIRYSSDGSNWSEIVLDPTKRSHSITGLVNGTQYTVRIFARNNSGLSTADPTVFTATPVGSPVPKTSPVSKIDGTRADLAMTVDSKGNLVTPVLEVGYPGLYSDTYSGSAANGASILFTKTLTGLTPGYTYQVRSKVLYGNTEANGLSYKFSTTPDSPSDLAATTTGSTAAVSWTLFNSNFNTLTYEVWAEQNGIEVGNRCTSFTGGGSHCVISGLSPGKTYVIKATAQTTGANYGNGVSSASSINVTTLAPQTIDFSFGTLPRKGYASLQTTFDASPFGSTSSGLPITYTSRTSTKCSVFGTNVTILLSGTCTIRASQAGNSKFAPATSVDASFVVAASQAITFSTNGITVPEVGGPTLDLSSRATASSGLTVAYSSTTPLICTVSGNTLSFVGAGNCRVVASQEGNDDYDPAPNIARFISVNRGSQSALSVTSTTGTYGTELVLATSGGSGTGIVSYVVDVNSVSATASGCSITSDGLVSTSAGKCAVIATKAKDANYLSESSASTLITLQKASQSIAFVPIAGSGTLLQGGTVTASASSSSGLSVTISSDTTSKCTVSGTSVSLVADGVCTLRGTQSGNSNYNAATAVTSSFEISPKPIPDGSPIDYVRLTSPNSYKVGDTVQLSVAPATYQGTVVPGTYQFISTSPGAMTFGSTSVDQDGNTHGSVTFARASLSFMLYAVFTPTDTTNFTQGQSYAAITVNKLPQNIVVNGDLSEYNQTRGITFGGIDSTGQVAIDLSPMTPQGQPVNIQDQQAHCTISNKTVVRDNPGFCYVRVNAMGDGVYESSQGVGTFAFTKLGQTIVLTNTDQLDGLTADNIGDTIDLTTIASASSTLTVTATSLSTSVCSISSMTLTVVSGGQCIIVFHQSGNDTYFAAADDDYTFNILRLEQAPLSLASISAVYGTPLALSASGGSGTGEFSFAVSDGLATGCTVVNGNLISTSSGSCLVAITKAGDASYLPKTTNPQLVDVARASQTIQVNLSTIQSVEVGSPPIDLAPFVATSSGSPASLRANDTRICSISGSILSVLEVGTCSLTASQEGTDNHEPAPDVVTSLTVAPHVEPIAVALPSTSTTTSTTIAKAQHLAPSVPSTVKKSQTLKFGMKSPSGLPMSVSASGVCKVSKVSKVVVTRTKVKGKTVVKKTTVQTGWLLSFTKSGTCTAKFKGPGDNSTELLDKTVKITVK